MHTLVTMEIFVAAAVVKWGDLWVTQYVSCLCLHFLLRRVNRVRFRARVLPAKCVRISSRNLVCEMRKEIFMAAVVLEGGGCG